MRPFVVTLEQDEDGVFIAEVPGLPGCQSHGLTREAALTNITDAIRLYLEELAANGPQLSRAEIVQIAV